MINSIYANCCKFPTINYKIKEYKTETDIALYNIHTYKLYACIHTHKNR